MTETMEKCSRNYGVDLLRMVSMFLVVLLHVLGQGGAMIKIVGAPESYYAAWFLETCAYCAVDLYGLISGYVGVESRHRPVRILQLWLQVFFYSAGITLLYRIFAPELLIEDWLWKALFPVNWKAYWYFSSYVGLFFLMPYLNKMMNSLTQTEVKRLAVTLFCVFSLGTIPVRGGGKDFLQLSGGYSFIWLLLLYLLGACLKKYKFQRWKKRWYLLSYFVLVSFSWLFKILMENYTREKFGEARFGRLFLAYTSPTILLCAVCLFLIFEGLEIRKGWMQKWICSAASLAFSVYLIHTHPMVWEYGMKGAFSSYCYLPPWAIVPAVIGTAAGIYAVCSLIDLIRSWLFRKIKLVLPF